jgi:hypothetical protein
MYILITEENSQRMGSESAVLQRNELVCFM